MKHLAYVTSVITLLSAVSSAQKGVGEPDFSDPRVLYGRSIEASLNGPAGRTEVIVSLARTPAMRDFAGWGDPARAARHYSAVAERIEEVRGALRPDEFTPGKELVALPAFHGSIDRVGLARLLADPRVEAVEPNVPTELQTQQGIGLINAVAAQAKYDGAGISIAILDTGIDYDHPGLGGGGFPNAKVIGGFDFVNGDFDPMDGHGHGTSVAGIAAGEKFAGSTFAGGVAPGARLYACKVMDDNGTGTMLDMIVAMDWVLTHANDGLWGPIRVVNCSIGFDTPGGGGYIAPGGITDMVTDQLANAGILVVGSSGNNGYCNSMILPAASPNVISVGAVYDGAVGQQAWSVSGLSCASSGGANPICTDTAASDQVICYSNSAPFLDVLAPSNNALTLTLGGGTTSTFGGTSAAAPYVAGALAILLSAASADGKPLTVEDFRATVDATGVPILDPKSGITTPRLDVGKAMAVIEGVVVDQSYIGADEIGTLLEPYQYLVNAVAHADEGDTVFLMHDVSTYGELVITKALTFDVLGGSIVIKDY